MNSRISKHRIPPLPLWSNSSKPNKQNFKMFDQRITFCCLPSRFPGAVTVPVIRMVFTHQGHPTMKATPCLSLKWRFLARVARPCLSTASHFFGLRISPSCSEIFNRRRISSRSSDVDKFLGRLGKIEDFFI